MLIVPQAWAVLSEGTRAVRSCHSLSLKSESSQKTQIVRNQEHIQPLTETLANVKGGQAAGNNCTLLCSPNTALKTRICHSSLYKLMNFCFLAAVAYSAEPALGQWEVLRVKTIKVSTVASHSPPWLLLYTNPE